MIKKLLQSFLFAFQGLFYCFKTQLNMKIHFFIALIVFTISFLVGLERNELLFILLAVTLVWVTEIINTSLEKVVDLIAPDYHPLAKISKNVAASAVLISTLFAIIVGSIIFGGYLFDF